MGCFDPTVHDTLEAAGYNRSFDNIDPDAHAAAELVEVPTPRSIDLDHSLKAVTLPQACAWISVAWAREQPPISL